MTEEKKKKKKSKAFYVENCPRNKNMNEKQASFSFYRHKERGDIE